MEGDVPFPQPLTLRRQGGSVLLLLIAWFPLITCQLPPSSPRAHSNSFPPPTMPTLLL